jgi:putative nucleotidyltransferase with HDIG domain
MSDNTNMGRVKDYITTMPSLPTTVSKVMEVCNNPKVSPTDLNRVISLDPVLMGRVLKLINSAYYGLGQQVTSLVRAIIMLGINTVKNLALSTAVLDRLGNGKEFRALNMEGFWRHSLGTAATARLLARRRGIDPLRLEEYFAAGLLHDIGKIPLNNVLSQEYVAVMALADRERITLIQAERQALGTDHCEVGAVIAESWKLDQTITDVIVNHHDPDSYKGANADLLYTVVVANYYATREEIGFSGDRFPAKPSASVYQALGITKDILEEITAEVTAEVEKAKVFLKVN